MRVTSIAAILLLSFASAGRDGNAMPGPTDTRGEVTAVEGTVLVLAVRSGPAPFVGDAVSVMRPLDAGGNATPVGTWRVTEVRGTTVRAVRERDLGGEPVVGMTATFSTSRGVGFPDGPDVHVPGAARSGVPGKVTGVRGRDVTVRLDGDGCPRPRDRATAIAYFRRAAKGGHARSQERLRQLGETW